MRNRFILHSLTQVFAATCSVTGNGLSAGQCDSEHTWPSFPQGIYSLTTGGEKEPAFGEYQGMPEILLRAFAPINPHTNNAIFSILCIRKLKFTVVRYFTHSHMVKIRRSGILQSVQFLPLCLSRQE